jgi:hypothetical protein
VPGLNPALPLLLALTLALPADHTKVASSNKEILRQAEAAFRLGVASQARVQEARRNFTEAAQRFGELHEHGVRSPALYLDLGNAEYLAGRPERALWAYHCGLRLDPNDRPLREHLHWARLRVQYPSGGYGRPAADVWPSFLPRPTPDLTLAGTATCYTLACFVATLWWWRRNRRLLIASLTLLGLAIGGLLILGWLSSQADYEQAHPLLIVVEETPLYRGNGPSYPSHPDVPSLPHGLEARQLLRRGSWLQVQLSSGEIGWLPSSAVLIVSP